MDIKRLGRFLSFAMLLAFSMLKVNAAVKIVYDPKCQAAVIANLGIQTAVETQHNQELDSILYEKGNTLKYATVMATIAESYQYAMQNIKGFGQESKYYTEIALCSYDIFSRIPEVVSAIGHAKIQQKAICIKELSDLYIKSEQLVNDFINIVNNSRVRNPLPSGSVQNKNDGYNLLDRYDRLAIAIRIYTDLTKIRYQLEIIERMAKYASWNDLFFQIDIESWAAVVHGMNIANLLISKWNNLL